MKRELNQSSRLTAERIDSPKELGKAKLKETECSSVANAYASDEEIHPEFSFGSSKDDLGMDLTENSGRLMESQSPGIRNPSQSVCVPMIMERALHGHPGESGCDSSRQIGHYPVPEYSGTEWPTSSSLPRSLYYPYLYSTKRGQLESNQSHLFNGGAIPVPRNHHPMFHPPSYPWLSLSFFSPSASWTR